MEVSVYQELLDPEEKLGLRVWLEQRGPLVKTDF